MSGVSFEKYCCYGYYHSLAWGGEKEAGLEGGGRWGGRVEKV